MLFERGYPKDAVRYYKRALSEDRKLYEAWFRIGLVEHREGNLRHARAAYRRCLRQLKGHGWCNFYFGLLEEQSGHPARAIELFRRAFKVAPELADPAVNPEVLYSKLDLAALIQSSDRARFSSTMPMSYLQPEAVTGAKTLFTTAQPAEKVTLVPPSLGMRGRPRRSC
jgi:tetratricopeptide (TPR) repeat protein